MASCRSVVASVFALLSVCHGQAGQGFPAWMRLGQIDRALRSAHVSGSLIYQGDCGVTVPEAPPVRTVSDSGRVTDTLQKMLAAIPQMRVTQERGGLVRMTQTDVPTDLLNFELSRISFDVSGPAAERFHGPNVALQVILMSPEVKAFRKARNIGPFDDGFLLPGNPEIDKPVLSGELENVTVSQALDYVLQTFPGFWVYESCVDKEGNRTARLFFFERQFPSKQNP